MITHFDEQLSSGVALCSMGLKDDRKFEKTTVMANVSCKSCIQKLMKYTGDLTLYVQGYSQFVGLA